jgi:hypothetical protein
VARSGTSCYDAAVKIAAVEVFVVEDLDIALFEQPLDTVPEGPGLGGEVDEAHVRRHAVTVSMP